MSLARLRPGQVRKIVFVATPNDGTPLADLDRPPAWLNALTNLAGNLTDDATGLVLELVKRHRHGLGAHCPGHRHHDDAAQRRGPAANSIANLPTPGLNLDLWAAAADGDEPTSLYGFVRTARDTATDAYFGGVRNDLIVPTVSCYLTSGAFHIPVGRRLVLDSSRAVDHSSFWATNEVSRYLLEWLGPDAQPDPVAFDKGDPTAEVAEAPDP